MGEFVTATDVGRRRERNEDAVLAMTLPDGVVLLAVADGVGGAPAGHVASTEAVRLLGQALAQPTAERSPEALATVFAAVDDQIRALGRSDMRLAGMCTTLVAALVINDRAWFANIGDSRGYLVANGQAAQITHDHSLVAEQVDAGVITPDEAWESEYRFVITRVVGGEDGAQADIFGPFQLQPGSRIVLTSDGAHDVVEPETYAEIAASGTAAEAAQRMIEAARIRGAPDNVTVAIYDH